MGESNIFNFVTKKISGSNSEMSFFEHLGALRKHLIRSVISIAVFTTFSFFSFDYIFNQIILGPRRADFWTFKTMCFLGTKFHLGPGYCFQDLNFSIINTEMAGQFTLQMDSSIMLGCVLSFPYILWELWRFIKPGLTTLEIKMARGFVFYASLLFLLGVLFGYFIITPFSVRFLATYTVDKSILNYITVDSYLSSVSTLTLATGVVFELPILAFFLAKLGILTPMLMKDNRRYAIVIMLIVAAVVTPTPDIQTMLIVTFPLLVLYEVSIVVVGRVYRKRIAA